MLWFVQIRLPLSAILISVGFKADARVRIFLLGDEVTGALDGFNPAHADYNPQEMLKFLAGRGTQIGVTGILKINLHT